MLVLPLCPLPPMHADLAELLAQTFLLYAHDEIHDWKMRAELASREVNTINSLMDNLEVEQHESAHHSMTNSGQVRHHRIACNQDTLLDHADGLVICLASHSTATLLRPLIAQADRQMMFCRSAQYLRCSTSSQQHSRPGKLVPCMPRCALSLV